MKKVLGVLFVLLFFVVGGAFATPFVQNYGSSVVLIDGDGDTNLTVGMASYDTSDGYYLKYSVNNSSWIDVPGYGAWDVDLLNGGDNIDFALIYAGSSDRMYVLSDDLSDDSFSATMIFDYEITADHSVQPIVTSNYFQQVHIDWSLVGYNDTFSTSYAVSAPCSGQGPGDGVAPVPEPATLLLLGSGLVGLAFLKRRKK